MDRNGEVRLTIAIPTFNRRDLVTRAVESALAQTLPAVEVIVSDNGSSDGTDVALRPYAERGVRLFRHATKTMTAAQNGWFLMQQARGQFFLILSDDDFLEPRFAAEVVAHFDRHPELSFVYTGCMNHYDDVSVPALTGPPVEDGCTFIIEHYRGQREVCWCAVVTRTDRLREVGEVPPGRIIGDMYYWINFAFRGPVGCVSEALSHYVALRPRGDNESRGTPADVWAHEQVLLLSEAYGYARAAGLAESGLASLEASGQVYISRSVANQFIWNRINGWRRLDAIRMAARCIRIIGFRSAALARLAAAIALPSAVLRRLVLGGAEKLASNRALPPISGP